jgi:hypothetical protein
MSAKPKKTVARLDLNRLLGLARSAVRSEKQICIRETPAGPALQVAGESVAILGEGIPEHLIVGCDLKNYSGLTELGQFIFGVALEDHLNKALTCAGLEDRIFAANGTGDGVLMVFDQARCKSVILFAMKLWLAGSQGYYDHKGIKRGLRVSVSSGPCLLGQDRAGLIKMQGYGLIEAARILGCDKGTHFLISKKLWNRVFGGQHRAKFSARRWTATIKIDGRLWRGKAKAKDRLPTEFFNFLCLLKGPHTPPRRIGYPSAGELHRPG